MTEFGSFSQQRLLRDAALRRGLSVTPAPSSRVKHLSTPPLRRRSIAFRLGVWMLCFVFVAPHMPANGGCAPSSGEILRILPIPPVLNTPSPEFEIQPDPLDQPRAGGARITLNSIAFDGNSAFSDTQLLAASGAVMGQDYDLAGLKEIANRVSYYYRNAGYSFAKAYLTQQDVSDGVIRLLVLEGRYGSVKARGDQTVRAFANRYLSEMEAGDLINGNDLESVVLSLGDVPGLRVAPVLKPSQKVGYGDLDVTVMRDYTPHGYFTFDNHGSRYSGKNRGSFGLMAPSPLGVGHELDVNTTLSQERLRVYNVGYAWPIFGRSRLRLDYTYVSYDLTNDPNLEEINGWAKIYRGLATTPLIRTQRKNLQLEYGLQIRKAYALNDAQIYGDGLFRVFPLRLKFSSIDSFAGGGSWLGQVLYARGQIRDQKNNVFERWSKMSFDVTRLQSLGRAMTFKWRVAGQGSEAAIRDSAEQMGLGGISAVRAYPSGEGSFSRAVLTQLEVQFDRGGYTPYIFADHAKGYRRGTDEPTAREIGGYGMGLRAQYRNWSLDGYVARKRSAAPSTADARDDRTVFHLSLQRRF